MFTKRPKSKHWTHFCCYHCQIMNKWGKTKTKTKRGNRRSSYNVIKMSMSDKDKALLNGTRGAAADIESTLEVRNDNASVMATNGESLNWKAFQVKSFAENFGTCSAVFLFFFDSLAYSSYVARPFEGIHGTDMGLCLFLGKGVVLWLWWRRKRFSWNGVVVLDWEK